MADYINDPWYFNCPVSYCSQCGRGCTCGTVAPPNYYTTGAFIPTGAATLYISEEKPKPSKKYDSWAKFYRTLKTTPSGRRVRGRRQSIPERLVSK